MLYSNLKLSGWGASFKTMLLMASAGSNENQVCIAQIVRKNSIGTANNFQHCERVIVFNAFLYDGLSKS